MFDHSNQKGNEALAREIIDDKSTRASEAGKGIRPEDPGVGKQIEDKEDAMGGESGGGAPAPEKKRPARKIGPCGNCKRVLTIQGKDRCGTCYQTGKKYPEGSEEQKKALADVLGKIERMAFAIPSADKTAERMNPGRVAKEKEKKDPAAPAEKPAQLDPKTDAAGITRDQLMETLAGMKSLQVIQHTMSPGHCFYMLHPKEREIIDAARLGKMIVIAG